MKTRAITTAAVSAALSVVFMLISHYVPVIRTTPLILACFAMQLVFLSGGVLAGVLSMAASLGICFAFSGLDLTFILSALIFYPYCLIAYFIRNFDYKGSGIFVRAAAVIAIANIGLAAVFFLTKTVLSDLMDIERILSAVGGYIVVALIFTVMFLIFDFVFLRGTRYLSKIILRGKK